MFSLNFEKKTINLFYPAYMLIYYVLMFGISITTFIGYPLVALIAIIGLSYFLRVLKLPNKNSGQLLMTAWTIYNVASMLMYVVNGLPLSCYIEAMQLYFFPMIFFYLGNNSKIVDDSFYKLVMASSAFFFLMGFYLYFATPSYYISYQSEIWSNTWYANNGVTEENVMNILRFSSFMSTSYVTSALSISTAAMAFSFLFRKTNIKPILLYSLAVVGIVGAILCQQRIAMGSVVVLLVAFSYLGVKYKVKGILALSIAAVSFFIVLVGSSFMNERLGQIVEMIIGRLGEMDFSEAMGGRSDQYVKAKNEILSWLVTGKGMGAGGHAAVKVGAIGVCDGEFFHLLLEFGILGYLILIPLIIKTLIRGAKRFRILCLETFVIFYILLTCIGANGLSLSYLIGPLFWFCMGRIWNNNYINYRLNEQYKQSYNRFLLTTISSHKTK